MKSTFFFKKSIEKIEREYYRVHGQMHFAILYFSSRKILRNTRERRDKIRFKRKIYRLLLPLFLSLDRGIRIDRWSDVRLMRPTYPLETSLADFLRTIRFPRARPRFLWTFIKFRNSRYPPWYFSQRMHINFRVHRYDMIIMRVFNDIIATIEKQCY